MLCLVKEDGQIMEERSRERRTEDEDEARKNSANINRVVATSKDTYSLRYFKVDQDEAEDEE